MILQEHVLFAILIQIEHQLLQPVNAQVGSMIMVLGVKFVLTNVVPATITTQMMLYVLPVPIQQEKPLLLVDVKIPFMTMESTQNAKLVNILVSTVLLPLYVLLVLSNPTEKFSLHVPVKLDSSMTVLNV
jgi:branched-subunit amino acid ABC-type transport system permease component